MKILKPGKVEMRKFVCSDCGCVFVARKTEMLWTIYGSCKCCPTCYKSHEWDNGEPYEEPTQDARNSTADYLIQRGVTFKEVQADE